MPPSEPASARTGPVVREFQARTGTAPDGVWSAPGRANLIGEHTDYNEGFALPFAIDRRCVLALGRRRDDTLRLVSAGMGEKTLALADARPGGVSGWPAYVAGPVWALAQLGVEPTGLDVVLSCDVPVGGGLSSSAAIECAVVLALCDLAGLDLPRTEMAQVAQRSENEVVGAPVGLLDQMASLLACADAAVALDFRTLSAEQVPLDPAAAGLSLLVLNTRVTHSHVTGSYGERRRACEQAARLLGAAALRDVTAEQLDEQAGALGDLLPFARHVVSEDERVLRTVELLHDGDLASVGPILSASHASLRDDFAVSCPELDCAVEAAEAAGALGARMMGGGFGGSALALVPAGSVGEVAAQVLAAAGRRTFPAPEVLEVRPAQGALRLQ